MSWALSLEETEEVLHGAEVGRLGLSYRDIPYVVPLCFLYYRKALYFHCSPKGRKIDYLQSNNKACCQIDQIGALIPSEKPCKYNFGFKSVLAEGTISFVTGEEERFTILQRMVKKYGGAEIAEKLMPEELDRVEILKLTITDLSGCAKG